MRRRLCQMERSDLIEYIKELEEENERLHSSLDPVHHPSNRIVHGNEEKEMNIDDDPLALSPMNQNHRHYIILDSQSIFEALKMYHEWKLERKNKIAEEQLELLKKIGGIR